jgi:hypothetical protein
VPGLETHAPRGGVGAAAGEQREPGDGGAARIEARRLLGSDDRHGDYGFVIRAPAAEPLGPTELAERLAVTKQAAIKVVDEMEARGFVALAESERMEAELRDELGDADVDALRRVLLRFAARHGGAADSAGARARPVW